MTKEKIIHARIDNDTHEKLMEKCNENSCTFTQYIDSIISESLEKDNESDQLEKKLEDVPPEEFHETQNEERQSPLFRVTFGRMYENGTDVGSSLDYEFNNGKVFDRSSKYLGNMDNKEPYVVWVDE